MENIFLDGRTKRDIDAQVGKVLRDLGNPEPPLHLEEVRELLRLDRAFYSAQDTGIIRETVHRLKVAGQQVLQRPTILLDAIRKLSLKALWVPDRRRILIDVGLPKIKHRWAEGHEILHGLIPWHEVMLHGDQQHTLSLACQEKLEAEANFGAGRLLFLQGRFDDHLLASPLSVDWIRKLATHFKNTITSTLWRAVEGLPIPAVGLVSVHPQRDQPHDQPPVRYLIRSARFAEEFSHLSELQLFVLLKEYCRKGSGPLGAAEIMVTDDNGNGHAFLFDTFFNHHEALTLGIHQHAHTARSSVA